MYNSSEYINNVYSWTPKHLRYEAKAKTKVPVFWQYLMQDVLPGIQKLANIYKTKTADKIIILGNDENEDVLQIPYFTRFSADYPALVEQKLRRVKSELSRYKRFHFLTLTVDPKMHTSLHSAYAYLTKLWNKVLTRLRKRYPNIFVIKTLELQKNGYPHLHILIGGIGFLPRQWLLKTKQMGLQFYKSKYLEGYGFEGAYNYILKYILKGSWGNEDWNYIQRVIQWALFARTYSTSRLSSIPVKINSNENLEIIAWYIIGFIYSDDSIEKLETRDDYEYEKHKNWT